MSYVVPRRGVGMGAAFMQAAAGYGLGAMDFNSGTVWSDWVAGSGGDNAAGKRAAQAIQAGLNSIGYGPIAVDGQFGGGSISAWNRFAADNGVPKDWPTQAGVIKLGEKIAQGGNQGGGGVQETHIVDGQYVPGPAPGSGGVTGSSMLLGLGIVAIVGIGILALAAKKKKGPTTSVPPKKIDSTMKSAAV